MTTALHLSLVVEAIDQATAPFKRMSDALSGPGRALKAGLGEAFDGMRKFSEGWAGLAAAVGGGFELRELVKEQDTFARLGIDAGLSADRVEHLKHSMYDLAEKSSVPFDQLSEGFRRTFGRAGINAAEESLPALAATIQRMGGYGSEAGELFGTLLQRGVVKGSDGLVQAMATLRQQMGPHVEWFADFTQSAPSLVSEYATLFNAQGPAVLSDLGGLYAAIREKSKTPRMAAGHLQQLMDMALNPQTALELQQFGVHILGRTNEEANTNLTQTGERRPLNEWFPELIEAQRRLPAFTLNSIIGPEMRDMLAQLSAADVVAKLKVEGDPKRYLGESAESAKTLQSAFSNLSTSIHEVGDAWLAWPMQKVADALHDYPTLVGGAVTALGSLAILGVVSGWVIRGGSALKGFVGLLGGGIAVVGDFALALRAGYGAFAALSLAAAANPLGATLAVVGLLVTGAYELWQHWDDIIALWEKAPRLWQAAKDAPSHISDVLAHGRDYDAAGSPLNGDGSQGANDANAAGASRMPLGSQMTPAASLMMGSEFGAAVTVRFENAPKGLRITDVKSDDRTQVRTDLGYAMGVP